MKLTKLLENIQLGNVRLVRKMLLGMIVSKEDKNLIIKDISKPKDITFTIETDNGEATLTVKYGTTWAEYSDMQEPITIGQGFPLYVNNYDTHLELSSGIDGATIMLGDANVHPSDKIESATYTAFR